MADTLELPNLFTGIRADLAPLEQGFQKGIADAQQFKQRFETVTADLGRGAVAAQQRNLDQMVADAKRRKFDVVVAWRLDRLGRNLRHLVTLIEELQTLGIAFVSLGEGIDCMTPAGKLQLHILAALAEFERERIRERVSAGLQRARMQGVRLGRPRRRIDPERLATVAGLPEREAARRLGIPRSTLQRALAQKPAEPTY